MNTAQKITSFDNLPANLIELHQIHFALSHDFMCIEQFVKNCTDARLLNCIRREVVELIKYINNYEIKDTESSSVPLETN